MSPIALSPGNASLIEIVTCNRTKTSMADLATGGILLFTIMIAAGTVPLIMAFKVKVHSLRILSLLLGLFAIVHGAYHLASGFQQELLADALLEPASLILLVGLGAYYSKVGIA